MTEPATGNAAEPIAQQTTTYLGFGVRADGTLTKQGQTTVPAGRADRAKQFFLASLAKDDAARVKSGEQDKPAAEFSVAVCPIRGWQEETFEPAPPEPPKFVSKGASA